MRLIAVIPAYNESASIARVVDLCKPYVDRVVVIDDGSKDNTAEVATRAGATVVSQPRNMGKGAALQAGMDYTVREGFDAAVFLDADGQHEPTSIPDLRRPVENGSADMAVGSRKHEWDSKMPLANRLTNLCMSWFLSFIARQPMEDTQNGYRLITARVMQTVRMETSRFEAESEFLLKAARRGYRIAWVPIRTIYGLRPSHIRPFRDSLRFFRMICRVLSS